MPLGRNIKNLRVARGLSREEVVGDEYSTSHLAAVEQGVKRPSIQMLDYVVDQLRVPLVKLLEEILHSAELPTPEMLRLARKLSRDGEDREAVRIVSETVGRDDVTTGQYRADCLSTQALVEYGRGNYERALEVYQQLRDLRERGGNRFLTARAYYYLGTVESQMGRYLRAHHWLFMGWQRLRTIYSDYPQFSRRFLLAYANSVMCTGGWSQAGELYGRIVDEAEIPGDGRIELVARWGLGLCHLQLGEHSEADEQLRKCLNLEDQIRGAEKADLMTLLGVALTEQGDAAEALDFLHEGLALRAGQDIRGQVRSICEIIAAHLTGAEVMWGEVEQFSERLTDEMLGEVPPAETALYNLVMAQMAARRENKVDAQQSGARALDLAAKADSYLRSRVISGALAIGAAGDSAVRLRRLLSSDMCNAPECRVSKMPHSAAVEVLIGDLHTVREQR